MKKDIHPKYFKEAEIVCACGAKYKVGSTVKKMQVEICSQCHPFFTGTGDQKNIDISGRVERFKKRAEKTAALKTKKFKLRSKVLEKKIVKPRHLKKVGTPKVSKKKSLKKK